MVISSPRGSRATASASLPCGMWLSGPPPTISVGALMRLSPRQAASSPRLISVSMLTTMSQSKPAGPSGPSGRAGSGRSRGNVGDTSSATSASIRSGWASATPNATAPPIECPIKVTRSSPSWSSSPSTSSRIRASEYVPGQSLRPCPRRSTAMTRNWPANASATSAHPLLSSPSPCSSTMGGAAGSPLSR